MHGLFVRRNTPTLNVRCPCGTSTSVPAGGAVTCDCGRTWDTARLPEADLRGLDRLVARSRRNRLVFVATMVFVVAALVLVGRSAPLPVAVAVFGVAWWRFCRPWWKRRRAPATSDLPTWELRSSRAGGDT